MTDHLVPLDVQHKVGSWFKIVTRVAVASLIATVIYSIAYVLMVERIAFAPEPGMVRYMFPEYQFRGVRLPNAAHDFFYPAFEMDTFLRHNSWHPSGFSPPETGMARRLASPSGG